jgi:hypothetical protein
VFPRSHTPVGEAAPSTPSASPFIGHDLGSAWSGGQYCRVFTGLGTHHSIPGQMLPPSSAAFFVLSPLGLWIPRNLRFQCLFTLIYPLPFKKEVTATQEGEPAQTVTANKRYPQAPGSLSHHAHAQGTGQQPWCDSRPEHRSSESCVLCSHGVFLCASVAAIKFKTLWKLE